MLSDMFHPRFGVFNFKTDWVCALEEEENNNNTDEEEKKEEDDNNDDNNK